jgi:hypothetical protein
VAVMAPIAETMLKIILMAHMIALAQYLRMIRNDGTRRQRELYLWRGPVPSPRAGERVSAPQCKFVSTMKQ